MGLDVVLGGCGFVGGHLMTALVERGRQVVCIDREPHDEAKLGLSQSYGIDLLACSEAELTDLFAGAEIVHHLVWSSIPSTAEADPGRDLEDNVGLTVRVLRAAQRANARVMFFSSGGTVYGEAQSELIDEDHPRRPVSAYGASKFSAEVYAEFFARRYDLDVRIARLANPYGSTQRRGRQQGAIARFARQALAGEPIEVWGDGSVVRDYIHVTDAAECLARLALAPRERLADGLAVNIGSGQGASLRELLGLVEKAVGRPLEVIYTPARSLDVSRNVLSIDRAGRLLDWRPCVPLTEGVERVMNELRRG